MQILQNILTTMQNLYYFRVRQEKGEYFTLTIPFLHYCIIIIVLIIVFCSNLYVKYTIFLALQQGRSFEATVIMHYAKKENSQRVKFQDSHGNILYGTYKGKLKHIMGKKARVYGKIYRCDFLQFLKSCNIYHSTFSLLPKDDKKRIIRNFINEQHNNSIYANLYNALFLSDFLDKPLRQAVTALGLAHLIAISGFHLASLIIMFYSCVCPLYFLLHRYFCYRNALYDLGFLGLIFAFCYLVLIDFEPSFLRAFIMACVGYVILLNSLKVFSFVNLFICALFAIAWNPSLIFHIGFLLSVSGVFCIFLFMCHSGDYLHIKNKGVKISIGIVAFNIIIFMQMMPIVHYFFPYFSPYQLVSIPLSICFVVLFPLVFVLHIGKVGYIFDSLIHDVLTHDFYMSEYYTPLWFLVVYIIILFLAIRYKWSYVMSIILSLSFYCWNYKIYLSSSI